MAKSSKKKSKRSSSKSSGGVLRIMRGGFKNMARKATGANSKNKDSKANVYYWIATILLLIAAIYIFLTRRGYL